MPAISRVILNDQEMEVCRLLAERRLDYLKKTNTASGRNWTEFNDVEKEALGFIGELGFCKLFNCYFHMDIIPDKDVPGKRGDAKILQQWIDVKTLTKYYKDKRLIVPEKNVEEYLCDIFALCSAKNNVVTFFGFMRRSDLILSDRLEREKIPYPGYVATEYELMPHLEDVL